jgi:hypothetical protein
MNIFVVDTNPITSAKLLPDRHVTKMILESAQMLSVVFSSHYWDIGQVKKVDGNPFLTAKGAFKNHPCTQWVAQSYSNCAWLIMHAVGLCDEFHERYDSAHGLNDSILDVVDLFQDKTQSSILDCYNVTSFARAMPENLKFDTSISDVDAYRQYLNTKEWCYYNYLKLPDRRPGWLVQPTE